MTMEMKWCYLGLTLAIPFWAAMTATCSADEPAKKGVPFETYSGYFVSNKFEPQSEESFVMLTTQEAFDKVFGVGMVMHDRSHRLAKDAFDANLVLGAIKRGKAIWEYHVEGISLRDDTVVVRYTATSKKSEDAQYACPLILSIAKGQYKGFDFVENDKPHKKLGPKGEEIPAAKSSCTK